MELNKKALEDSKSLLKKNERLLFLTSFGSKLYGTNTPSSDTDYKGLFLPTLEDVLTKEDARHYTFSTGASDSKNTSEDTDVQLWSLGYWLDLLKKGDTNALDLFFAMFSEHQEKFFDEQFENVIKSFVPSDFFDLKSNKAFVGYTMHQAKKYGLKGSSVGLLKDTLSFLKQRVTKEMLENDVRLGTLFQELLKRFEDKSLFFEKEMPQGKMLFVLGKGFDSSLRLSEALERLQTTYDKFGHRAKEAEQNNGVDWKAVSHAFRCLLQMEEMLETGFLQFPLKDAPFLLDVKQKKFTWKELDPKLAQKLAEVDAKANMANSNAKKMAETHRAVLLKMYGLR